MLTEYSIFAILLVTLGLFVWGHWRYDVVAAIALMAAVFVGAVPFRQAFTGFSNPAVITVAAVMIMTQAITRSGLVDYAVNRLAPVTNGRPLLHIASLTVIAAVLSAFMNNVGALALVMPIAMQTAAKSGRSPSLVLMPIAFGSILGGMTTMIGTPPNILISTYRREVLGQPFAMFDFTPVGLGLTIIGIIFIVLIGWRLIPKARLGHRALEDVFQIEDYITEVLVPEESPLIHKTLRDLEELTPGEFQVLGLIRGKRKFLNIAPTEVLRKGDIVIIEAASSELEQLVNAAKLELVGSKGVTTDQLQSKNVDLIEVAVIPGSRIEGRTPQRIRLRSRYGINLLAISRQGEPFRQRLKNVKLQAGDVLLLQGNHDTLTETAAEIGFLPLAKRELRIGMKKNVLLPIGIFFIALCVTSFKLLPVSIAFAGAVLMMLITNVIPIRTVYDSVDWSILVLLGAMIPVGNALQTTGGTQLIANWIASVAGALPPSAILAIVMVVTMTLSDVMNNAATAVVMAPIAVSIAESLGYNVNPFLMAVAVGASCAFLTPIGHQNNTLVMGPGGYHFGDYWRMGLPLELLIIITGLPLIMWFWPLW